MPLTLCTQKVFLIESKLNFFFLLHLDLEIFIAEREHFTLYSFVKFCESHPNASVYMYQKEVLIESKLNAFWGGSIL